ncbi:MAG TPA: multicopper oxidase domain-containing protein, partial [Flavisolibacter sp.]|nr:multicopper oxidase domain-containing protein [Flavisolibacter sp.]
TEKPLLNSNEIWEIYNETMDAHPVHLHMVRMQVINRQKFTAQVNEETGKPENIRLLGQPLIPGPEERGWKDTWVSFPGEVTRVVARFDLEGLYVWHCHILSHEDHEMMRPFFVLPETLLTRETKPNGLVDSLFFETYPNPFQSDLTIVLQLPKSASISIHVYNSEGRLVKELTQTKAAGGIHTFTLDASHWTKGPYVCEIQTNSGRVSKVIIRQ